MPTPVTSRPDPTAETAHEILVDGLDADAVLTVVGRCTVAYSGRTERTLGAGDRLVVLKPDGTLLVHQPSQRDPVNWQPPGCRHSVEHLFDGGDEWRFSAILKPIDEDEPSDRVPEVVTENGAPGEQYGPPGETW